MVSRAMQFPQLMAGSKSRPHDGSSIGFGDYTLLRRSAAYRTGIILLEGVLAVPPTCCPSGIFYLPPRLSSSSRFLPSPSPIDCRPACGA